MVLLVCLLNVQSERGRSGYLLNFLGWFDPLIQHGVNPTRRLLLPDEQVCFMPGRFLVYQLKAVFLVIPIKRQPE